MNAASPLWLVGLFALFPVWWIHRNGIGAVGRKQRLVATAMRSLLVVALTSALAGVSLTLPERKLATVFVVDRSDSVGGAGKGRAEEFVRLAIEDKPNDALAGVVLAGEEARVELSVQEDLKLGRFATEPGGSRTDLARALRLGAAILPDGTRRRIVLLSDGRENSGDARAEARRLARDGIRLDTVEIAGHSGPDVGVVRMSTPSRVRQSDLFDVEVEVFANFETTAELVVVGPDGKKETRSLQLEAGQQTIRFPWSLQRPGPASYRATITADRDVTPKNDSAESLTIVMGPPRVLILEVDESEGDALSRALSERGFSVERRNVSSFPTGIELAATDSIVLLDIPGNAIPFDHMETLAGFVRYLGRGLVAIGGESSWSLGNYRGTLLEELLPVSSEIKDPKRRPSIAQALVIDVSGSMSGEKSRISKAAAARAAHALSGDDQLGVLGFSDTSEWVIPIQKLPSKDVVNSGIAKLDIQGGTNIPGAIDAAAEGLEKTKAALKHMILFSDGFNGSGDLMAAAQRAADKGITVSVVGTGESAAQDLARLAEVGKGRFYPGRDLSQIPDIIMNEVILAARKYVNEGEFVPKVTGSSAATDDLDEAPAVLGYIGTSAKPSTAVTLSVGEFDDPLLATWRAGTGIATAWTSDLKGRWASRWLPWDGFADFWSKVLKETLPADPVPGFSARIQGDDAGIHVAVEAESVIPESVGGKATLVDPSGRSFTIALERAGLSRFEGRLTGGDPGAYLATVELNQGNQNLYRDSMGVVKSYSSEYSPGVSDNTLLTESAQLGGGRTGIEPSMAFRRDLPLGRRQVELTSWLLVLAMLLFPLDVALRRVSLYRDDLRAVSWRKPKVTTSDSMDRLIAVTRRLRKTKGVELPAAEDTLPSEEAGSIPAHEKDQPAETASALLAAKRRRGPG